ncbi:tetratricopeptide repeat protein 19, mitochondrial-like isoform X2 [Pecten maximus]|uniref:tetratricopeptide repeat protein 19, mitochondrial-like isoform X1 n=1 Tax=Pecten maximus TaxID=6579 RepID=UPI0014582FD3|nr:tetratricopeptide repeat protein 19, mitochondrial-like isoform X1 [Pecten maximus]XP_033734171.1 tetratricopeptide repeat protein 19, mitochondrial-like isoform X2 [Pecten maximus]
MAAPMKHVCRIVRACSDKFYKHIGFGNTYRTKGITEYTRLIIPRKYPFYSNRFQPLWKHASLTAVGMWSLFTMKKEEVDEAEKEEVAETDKDKDKDSAEDRTDIENYVRLAKMAQLKKEFDEADMYYHKALKVANKKFNEDKISKKFSIQARTYIFDAMADMALSQGQFDKAEALYKDTLKGYLETGGDRKDNAVMELTLKLSSLYAIIRKDHEARLGLTTVIECQEEKIKTNPKSDIDTYGLLGIALQTYGRYLLHHNELEKAETVLCRCEEICTHAVGENSSQMLKVLNDLAAVQIIQARYTKAEVTLQKALVISQTMESCDAVHAIYSNLGAISLKLSHLDIAESRCSTAFKLAKDAGDEFAQKQARHCLDKVNEARQSQPVK